MRLETRNCVNPRANDGIRCITEFSEFEASGPSLLERCRRRSWKAWQRFDFVEFAQVDGDSFTNSFFERVGIDWLEKSAC
jgi:hypothetical protein